MRFLCLLLVLCGLLARCSAFVAAPLSALPSATRRAPAPPAMGNNAPEGPFTPIVRAGKVVLGEKRFNKIRGKVISYHSQFIGEFCEDYGVPKDIRGGLVKKAKITGGQLGFLN